MKKRLSRLAGMASLLLSSQGVLGFSPTNFSLPHEGYVWTSSKYLLPEYHDKEDPKSFRLSSGAGVEYGFSPKGYDKDGKEVGPYQIYYPSENLLDAALSADGEYMVDALANMSLLGGNNVATQTADSGFRFKMTDAVSVKETDIMLWSRLALPIDSMPGQVELGTCCPVKFFETSNVHWSPIDPATNSVPPVGGLSYMTEDVRNTIFSGSTLNATSWNKTGLGDLNVFLSWKNHYTQVNDALSSVGIYAQIGLSLATSSREDLNKNLALPFGYDGSTAVPMSAAINLHFSKNLRLCGSVDAVFFFADSSDRMTRTKESEGSLWLSNKTFIRRSPGTLLGFNTLLEGVSNCKRYSVGILYSFIKKYEDRYSSNTKVGFVDSVANKSEYALDKSCHTLNFRGSVDFQEMVDSNLAPTLSISYKYPLKGERMLLFKTVKVEASVSF
jgi:hypothetical protein